jgi:solute:Na+ symporter, SSS family
VAGIDVVILLAFVAYAVAAGLRSRRIAGGSLDEYFLAGRSLPGWKAGLSMAATQFAADTPLLVTGLIATAGVFALWRLWIYAVAFLLLGFVLAPSWRRAGVLTDAELTEVRYGGRAAAWLRAIKALYFGTFFNCIVLSFVLLAATRISEPFLIWDAWLPEAVHRGFVTLAEWIGTPLTLVGDDPAAWPADVWIRSANNLISLAVIVLVTTFYSTTGGLRSVVATDVVQLILMLAATAAFAWIAVDRAGGLGELPDRIRDRFAAGGPGGITGDEILGFTPSVTRDAGLALLGVFALQWLAQMNSDGTGYLAQRVMACRSDRDARAAAVWFTVVQILLRSLLWIPLGLALLLLFPFDPDLPLEQARAEREYTYVLGMAELPAGLSGLLLTAMLAALASTVDTHLNWGSSYWTNDLYGRFYCRAWRRREPEPRALVRVARLANLLILTIALVVMTRLGSIASAWQTSLLLGAGMGGVLVLRWIWWRLTAWGELSAILASAVLAPILLATIDGPDAEALRLLAVFAGSTATGVVVSLVWPHAGLDGLGAFYRRARPPGFWGPVARAARLGDPAGNEADALETIDRDDDRRRLAIGGACVVLAALAIFSTLTLIGSLITDSAPPTWLPYRGVWLAVLVFGALGPLPALRHLARRTPPT